MFNGSCLTLASSPYVNGMIYHPSTNSLRYPMFRGSASNEAHCAASTDAKFGLEQRV